MRLHNPSPAAATLGAYRGHPARRSRPRRGRIDLVEGKVAVVGIGHAGFAPIMAGLSYKELMFEAAQRAYFDAGLDPRTEIDSFVCCSEDLLEGTSIFDEYVPDQLGAMQRPVQTV